MLLGIDIGTTTVSGVLARADKGAILRTATRANRADVVGEGAGFHEQCPTKLLDAFRGVVTELLDGAAGGVSGIALTGQMHGIVAVDAELNPLTNLITWRDRRTACYPDALCRHGHAEETGCFLHAGYGGLTLHHLLKSGALPPKTHKVLSAPGFIAAQLTGLCTVDETFAASWGIWDVRRNRWHEELLSQLGIPAGLLPDFVPSCTVVGKVRDSGALLKGVCVFSPVGDNQAGVLGVLKDNEGQAVVNIGTSSQLSVPLLAYTFNPALETRPLPGGKFIQVFSALCGGWSYAYLAGFFRQVVEVFSGQPIELPAVFACMERIAASEGASGLCVDTRFAGDRSTRGRRTGRISGITTDNFTPQNLVRAFAEGIAGELAAPADFSGISSLAAVGNAVRMNPVLRQALESRFGLPCRLSDRPEEAAFGAVQGVLNMRDRDS